MANDILHEGFLSDAIFLQHSLMEWIPKLTSVNVYIPFNLQTIK